MKYKETNVVCDNNCVRHYKLYEMIRYYAESALMLYQSHGFQYVLQVEWWKNKRAMKIDIMI